MSLALSLFLAVISAILYFFAFPPEIPLLYSLARPQDWLTDKVWIAVLPALGFLFSLGQIPITVWFQQEPEIADTINWSVVFFVSLLCIACIRIAFLVL